MSSGNEEKVTVPYHSNQKSQHIDPRRDCDIYSKMATEEGMRIASVLETHRNEDYVIGSVELSSRTGAEVWHADGQLDYRYGEAVEDRIMWWIGRLKIEAISTPGM